MNVKLTVICLFFLLFRSGAYSQSFPYYYFFYHDLDNLDPDTSYWKIGGINTLTSSHVSLINWAAGGQNSISANLGARLFADYRRGRHSWENTLDLAYGIVKQGDAGFNKSDDRLNLVTKYGYQISSDNIRWYFSGLLDFRTQFAKGYGLKYPDSVISRFMAPGYLIIGLGIDYKPHPSWSFNYVPVTGKFTFVMDESLSNLAGYGVDTGKVTRQELGSFMRLKFHNEVWTNVELESRMELFTNYVENFGSIDVNWQNLFILTINKWLKVNFDSQLIYDDDIRVREDKNEGENPEKEPGPRVQFKTVFGAGFSFKFGDKREKQAISP